jgi:hypothetical protein
MSMNPQVYNVGDVVVPDTANHTLFPEGELTIAHVTTRPGGVCYQFPGIPDHWFADQFQLVRRG